MAAYLVGNITVTDPEAFQRYREQVPAVIARHGGRYLVRGGAVHPLEGEPAIDRFVVIEFASVEAARQFYSSADYAPLLRLRMASSRSDIALVEGYAAG